MSPADFLTFVQDMKPDMKKEEKDPYLLDDYATAYYRWRAHLPKADQDRVPKLRSMYFQPFLQHT